MDPEQPHEGSVTQENPPQTFWVHIQFTHLLGTGSGCDSQTFVPTPQQRGFFQLLGPGCRREASQHAGRTVAGKERACFLPQSISTQRDRNKQEKNK